jgi:hypothetical protein
MRTRTKAWLATATIAAALSVAIPTAVIAQEGVQQADDVGNAPTLQLSPDLELIRVEDALLTRDPDGLTFEISMDVPTPATYVYPDEVPPGRRASPELFTMWSFIFNFPEACTSGSGDELCGPDDFTDAARGGVYGLAGHVTAIDVSGGPFELDRDAGGRMTFHRRIEVGDPERPNPEEVTYPLENPLGAEVHVAIAPHGQMDPATVVTELFNPAGNPDCGCWWGAAFLPPG